MALQSFQKWPFYFSLTWTIEMVLLWLHDQLCPFTHGTLDIKKAIFLPRDLAFNANLLKTETNNIFHFLSFLFILEVDDSFFKGKLNLKYSKGIFEWKVRPQIYSEYTD